MTWEVGLAGDHADLRILAQSFTGLDFAISKSGEEFVLSSAEFEVLNNARKIQDRVLAFLELLNGAARLALEARTPITIGRLGQRHADGRHDVFGFMEPIRIQFRAQAASVTVPHLDGSTQTYHPADPIRQWITLASSDREVAKALKLLSSGVWDWVNLYRIFEVVSSDCGGDGKIEGNGWATKSAIRLFKHTANSPGAIGTVARHGAESTTPPPKPMLLPEARTLVLGIVQAWFRDKSNTP